MSQEQTVRTSGVANLASLSFQNRLTQSIGNSQFLELLSSLPTPTQLDTKQVGHAIRPVDDDSNRGNRSSAADQDEVPSRSTTSRDSDSRLTQPASQPDAGSSPQNDDEAEDNQRWEPVICFCGTPSYPAPSVEIPTDDPTDTPAETGAVPPTFTESRLPAKLHEFTSEPSTPSAIPVATSSSSTTTEPLPSPAPLSPAASPIPEAVPDDASLTRQSPTTDIVLTRAVDAERSTGSEPAAPTVELPPQNELEATKAGTYRPPSSGGAPADEQPNIGSRKPTESHPALAATSDVTKPETGTATKPLPEASIIVESAGVGNKNRSPEKEEPRSVGNPVDRDESIERADDRRSQQTDRGEDSLFGRQRRSRRESTTSRVDARQEKSSESGTGSTPTPSRAFPGGPASANQNHPSAANLVAGGTATRKLPGQSQLGAEVAGSGDPAETVLAAKGSSAKGVSAPTATTSETTATGIGLQSQASAATSNGSTAIQKAEQRSIARLPIQTLNRITSALKDAPAGDSTMRLRLNPIELGNVDIEISFRKGVMSARLRAESGETRHLLQEGIDSLKSRLAEHGIRVESLDVELGSQSSGSGSQSGQSQSFNMGQGQASSGFFRQQNQDQTSSRHLSRNQSEDKPNEEERNDDRWAVNVIA